MLDLLLMYSLLCDNIPCYSHCYEFQDLFCGCLVYYNVLMKPARAGKKAITTKYMIQELNTIILALVVLNITRKFPLHMV